MPTKFQLQAGGISFAFLYRQPPEAALHMILGVLLGNTFPRWQPTVAARVASPATAPEENSPVLQLNRYPHLYLCLF